LLSFEKEFKKSAKKGDPAEMALPLWSHIEAMAFFLNTVFEANRKPLPSISLNITEVTNIFAQCVTTPKASPAAL